MSKKPRKSTVVAFKVEEDLAEFLNGLPNKSDFIRHAIYNRIGVTCPLCNGTAKVSKDTHDRFRKFLEQWEVRVCGDCGDPFAMPREAREVDADSTPATEEPETWHHCSGDEEHSVH